MDRVVMQNVFRPDSLADFSPSGQQARDAALLRATTDLFAQELAHDRDEIRRYEELATHFLPRVPPEDRAFVAEQLAVRLDAPQSVIRMLAKDRVDIARHVIGQSPVLGPLDLLTIIAATGPDHHRLIAKRANLAPEVEHALRLVGDQATLDFLGTREDDRGIAGDVEISSPVEPSTAAAAAPSDVAQGRSEALRARAERLDVWQFLGLDRAARLKLMAALATRPPVRRYAGPASRLDRAFRTILSAAQIVGFARSGQRQALVEAIAGGLGLEQEVVVACLDDATGEPAAVLLKALGLDNVQAQQVLLLATPTVGFDVSIFFRASDLYAGMEKWIAEILVDAWRENDARPAPRHEPHLAENGARRRPVAAERTPDRLPPPAERARRG
jgi:uncharacterized protein (DUF2336 family)